MTTPGADNLSEAAAGGGISGIAIGVANANERQSGVQALRDIENMNHGGHNPQPGPAERYMDEGDSLDMHYMGAPQETGRRAIHSQQSYNSQQGLRDAAYPPAVTAAAASRSDQTLPTDQQQRFPGESSPYYNDTPYNRWSTRRAAPGIAPINPNDIADDGDDGLDVTDANHNRRSFLPFGGNSRNASREGVPLAGAAAGGAVAGAGAAGMFSRDPSGKYAPVGAAADLGSDGHNEKSEWLSKQSTGNKRLKWIVGTIIAIVIVGAIVGGVVGGVLAKKNSSSSSSSSGQSAADDEAQNGDLGKDSSDIQQLMNNKDLYKVFPGMDYTPLNAQYPDCLTNPPSQNNVTRDMAVMSQLTNAVRLYGTDCNQTEMVLHAIDRLELTDMKVWMGVWLGDNDTTNTRQLSQMWTILDANGADPFAGVIVGNEVLYRKDLTETQLANTLKSVKSNMTKHSWDLPLATSDLGDNWTASLAEVVDIVMSNIHPFFAGVTAEKAAGWTWQFWQWNDIPVTQGMTGKKQIIAETGWPSGGGNDCGTTTACTSDTAGSIAGVDEMNIFMEGWVCQALENGTDYFWFEAFDEPWKIIYNTKSEQWEDKWGLMDVNRNLKSGVTIPDCGGKTV